MAAAECVRRQLWARCRRGRLLGRGPGARANRRSDREPGRQVDSDDDAREPPRALPAAGDAEAVRRTALGRGRRESRAGAEARGVVRRADLRRGSPLVGVIRSGRDPTRRWTSSGRTSKRRSTSSLGRARTRRSGFRMATDLWLYWLVRGRYRAGSRRLEALLGDGTGIDSGSRDGAVGVRAPLPGDRRLCQCTVSGRGGTAGLRADGRRSRAGVRAVRARAGSPALGEYRAGG